MIDNGQIQDNVSSSTGLLTTQINRKSISVGRDRDSSRLAATDCDGTLGGKDSNLARARDLDGSSNVGPGDMGALHRADDSLSAADGLRSHCKIMI